MINIRDQFILLEPNKPITFEFDTLDDTDAFITDSVTKRQKTIQRFLLHATTANGRKVDNFVSFLSKKAMEILNELNARGVLLSRPIKITRSGSGFRSQYSFEVL